MEQNIIDDPILSTFLLFQFFKINSSSLKKKKLP